MLAILVSFFLVSLIAGPFQGFVAILGFGLLGIALGIAIKKKMALSEILLIGSLTSFISKVLLVFAGLWLMGVNPLLLSIQEIDQGIASSLSFYQSIGFSQEQIEIFKNTMLQSLELIKVAFPAMLVLGSVLDTIINYWVAGWILNRLGYIITPLVPFREWRVSSSFFWSYTAGIFLLIIDARYHVPLLQKIGINIQLLFSMIFLFTGLALWSYLFYHYKIKSFFFWVTCLLIFIQPVLSLLVTWVGIFDVWLDFRTLWFKK